MGDPWGRQGVESLKGELNQSAGVWGKTCRQNRVVMVIVEIENQID